MNNKRKPQDSGERRPNKPSGNKFSKERKSDSKGSFSKRSSKPYSSRSVSDSKRKFKTKPDEGNARNSYSKSDKKREFSGERRERKSYSSDKPFRTKKEFGADKFFTKRSKPEGDSSEKKSFSKSYRGKKEFGDKKPYATRTRAEGENRERKNYSSDKPLKRKREFNSGKPFFKGRKSEGDSRKTGSSGKAFVKRESTDERGERKSYSSGKQSGFKKESKFSRKPYTKREEGVERRERPYSNSKFSKPGKFSKKSKATDGEKEIKVPEEIRLNRYISNAGVCSRRDADKLIQEGRIKVNGKVVDELGFKVKRSDVVKLDGQTLNPEKLVYLLLNKPKDYITTMEDPEDRRTVMNLIKNACEERIYPVGRLDRNTTGLLLFTNDGELAKKLTHPSYEVKKIYQADLDKPLAESDFEKIAQGEVELEDGKVSVDKIAYVSPDGSSIGLEIHEGRNRIVRRIFEHLGYEVVKLDRVMYAGLDKKDLPRGKWRMLTDKEIVRLKHFN